MAGTNIGHTSVGSRRLRMAGEMEEGLSFNLLSSGLMWYSNTKSNLSPSFQACNKLVETG